MSSSLGPLPDVCEEYDSPSSPCNSDNSKENKELVRVLTYDNMFFPLYLVKFISKVL